MPNTYAWVLIAVAAIFVFSTLARSIRIVPQAQAFLVQRLGRYSRTLDAGLHLLIPFVDKVRAGVDLIRSTASSAEFSTRRRASGVSASIASSSRRSSRRRPSRTRWRSRCAPSATAAPRS